MWCGICLTTLRRLIMVDMVNVWPLSVEGPGTSGGLRGPML